MASKYEGFVGATPIARGLRRAAGNHISRSMPTGRKPVRSTKDVQAEAYQKGILNTLYAWEVMGLPIPGFDKFLASQGQSPDTGQGPPMAPPMAPPAFPPAPPMLPIQNRPMASMGPMMPPPGMISGPPPR